MNVDSVAKKFGFKSMMMNGREVFCQREALRVEVVSERYIDMIADDKRSGRIIDFLDRDRYVRDDQIGKIVRNTIELYNTIDLDFVGDEDVWVQPYFRRYAEHVWNDTAYTSHWEEVINDLSRIVQDQTENEPIRRRTEMRLQGIFNFPVYFQEVKRKMAGLLRDSHTGKVKFMPVEYAFPGPDHIRANFGSSKQTVNAASGTALGFVKAVFQVKEGLNLILTEKEKDFIPKIWTHSEVYNVLSFKNPETEADPKEIWKRIANTRRYVIPEQGVEVSVKGYGDVESLWFKHAYRDSNLLVVKIVLRSGQGEDLLVLDTDFGEPVAGGMCANMRSEKQVIALHTIIAKAYENLCCAKTIRTANHESVGAHQEVSRGRKSVSGSSDGYVYLPRAAYEGDSSVIRTRDKVLRRPHAVGGHLKRLPIGWRASEEALEKARKDGIHVPHGYTYVKDYCTGQNSEGNDSKDVIIRKTKFRMSNDRSLQNYA